MSSESRTGRRFPLELPITIRNEKSPTGETATTSNVSASGVYIEAKSAMHVGSTIEFDISLPASVVGTEEDVEIHCKGRVIRMDEKPEEKDKHGKQQGVACVIDHYKFIRKGKH